MAKRGAQGAGTIRKKTITRNGKEYTYWEARVTTGRDPGTGKQVQRSITGKTQKEVLEKLRAITQDVSAGTYTAPSRLTVGQWLDIWLADYLSDAKPHTVASYATQVRVHLKPAFGAVGLAELSPHQIQRFYNSLDLSPKSVRNIHGILHSALEQAVEVGYIRYNPAHNRKLPRMVKKEVRPLHDDEVAAFLTAIHGHPFEAVYKIDLFTGMRQGEILGLTWDCVDFSAGTICINKQLQKQKQKGGGYVFATLKNDKARRIRPAPSVMDTLKAHKAEQARQRLKAGPLWEAGGGVLNAGEWGNGGLVFTDDTGRHLAHVTVYKHFKRLVQSIGIDEARFHDLRHSYAVAALQSGDDIKTVQEALGHHTAAFTLDVYGHVSEQMKAESAARMERFIKSVSNCKGKI